jgi:hypothetical protein
MKLQAIMLSGIPLSAVIADERYEHVRRLVGAGSFGPLTGDGHEVEQLLAGAAERHSIRAEGREPESVDAEMGLLLEGVDTETVVLVLAANETSMWYVLAAPGSVPAGQTEAVDVGMLASLVGELLVREAAAGDEDDDAMLRERFSGLGYIS